MERKERGEVSKSKPQSASWARREAHRVLCAWSGNERRTQLRPLLQRTADRAAVHQREKGLFWQIVLGVVRSFRLLDALVKASAKKGMPGPGAVRQALRIGLYQLLYLDRVPARAAVDQSVRLVEGRKAKALVNAILRRAADSIAEGGEVEDPLSQVALPGGRLLSFPEPFLPDPEKRKLAYLAVFYSYPDFLVRKWTARWGEERARELLEAGNTTPPLNLRVNPLRATPEEVAEALRREGVEGIREGARPGTFQVDYTGNPARLEVLKKGWVTVQDQAAMRAVEVLDPKPGQRVLDLCAAPGGKTTQAAELMGDRGEIVAWDIEPRRLERVARAVERLGLTSVKVARGASLEEILARGPYDRVLADVPCTSTGVLARRPEGRWKLKAQDYKKLPALQREILAQAARAVAPGGVLVYSTCSLEEEENERVVETLEGWEIMLMETTLPQAGVRDGSFVARLEKKGSS